MKPASTYLSLGHLCLFAHVLLLFALAVANARSTGLFVSARSVSQSPIPNTQHNSQTQTPQRESALTLLVEGATLRKEIRAGEPQFVGVALNAGQYAQVIFRWRGVDLDASVFKPDDNRAESSPVPIRAAGPTSVSVIAEVAGVYRFEVRPAEALKINGGYEVRLEAVRQPTPADELRVKAERALAEGTKPGAPAAKDKIEESLRLWQSAEDIAGQASAHHALAELHRRAAALENAVKEYQTALALRQKMTDAAGEAHTLLDLGRAYRDLHSPGQALPSYARALTLFRSAGDRTGESMALYATGFALARDGKYREAVKYYEEALSIQSADGDRLREARTLTALGGAYDPLDEYDRALAFYQKSIPIRLELDDRLGGAIVLNNINVLNEKWGDWQKTKENYETALSVYESLLKNGWTTCESSGSESTGRICEYAAFTLDNLGELYNTLGDPQAALTKFEKSLKIHDAINQPRGKGLTRARMCYSHLLEGKPQEALELCQAAQTLQKSGVDPPGLAYTHIVMGMIYDTLGETRKALDSYDRALQFHSESGDLRGQAITLDKAGDAYARARDVKSARAKFERALQIWQRIKDQDGETISLYKLARAERDLGNLTEAHARISKALDIVESLRVKVTSQRLRASYFATKLDYYELAIDLKMQLAKAGGLGVAAPAELVASAFQANERARARVLFDILLEARVEPRGDSDRALTALFRRQQELQQKLNYKAALQTRLLAGKTPAEALAAVEKEVAQLAIEYDEVDGQIRARSPRYAELTRPQPLSLAEIQRQLLDEQTLLLAYALGEERSYLWVVSRAAVKFYELPRRAEIEAVARRVSDILRAEQKQPGEPARAHQTRLALLDAQFRDAAAGLSRMLLSPAVAELGRKRLLVVAGGDLQQVPFAALPIPEPAEGVGELTSSRRAASLPAPDERAPVASEHEIVYVPSASTLAALRAETRQPPPKAVAILADPVFERDDARLQLALKGRSQTDEPPTRLQSLQDAVRSWGVGLPRLLASRQEAKGIKAAAPEGMARVAWDFEASRATATDAELVQYRIIHFATHGVFNDRQPELSGIVLSLFDERGQPREDGFLRLHDIYNLKLPVEMVVLSACQTGLGKQVRGEGLIGLTRGFMYAGVPRVVASLWKVDDEATAELMRVFYERMFKDGMPPPAALREAQLSVRSQKRWRAPYYWAGFIIQGEWK
jgi:tetratricopeptide (TPR) repeat protein